MQPNRVRNGQVEALKKQLALSQRLTSQIPINFQGQQRLPIRKHSSPSRSFFHSVPPPLLPHADAGATRVGS